MDFKLKFSGKLSPSDVRFLAFILGFTSAFTQLLFLRQFLDLFGSNEFLIGLILASWMLYTSLGVWIGGRTGTNTPVAPLFGLMAVLPLLLLILSYPAKHLFLLPGIQVGPGTAMLFTLLMLPFCIVSGFTFASLSDSGKQKQTGKPIRVYAYEAAGFGMGGIIFSILALWGMSGFFMAALLLPVNLLISYYPLIVSGKKWAFVMLFLFSSALPFVGWKTFPDNYPVSMLYEDQILIKTSETPYGRLSITSSQGQINLYSGGIPVFSSQNEMICEEIIHFTLLQSSHPDRILLVSGNPKDCGEEIELYNPNEVIYLSINPWLIPFLPDSLLAQGLSGFYYSDKDPVQFLVADTSFFDAIILNIPAPATFFINKFYSEEFIRLSKKRLSPSGIITWLLPTSMNYPGSSARELNSCLALSIKKYYKNLLLIPGNSLYFIASDSVLRSDFAAETEKRHIQPDYVNAYYISDDLLQERIKETTAGLNNKASANTLWHPAGYYNMQKLWLDQHGARITYLVFTLLILTIFLWQIPGVILPAIAVTGFISAAFEYVVMLEYQLAFGNLSAFSGILVSFYMFGSGFGARASSGIKDIEKKWKIGLCLGAFMCLFIPLMVWYFNVFSAARLGLIICFLCLQLLSSIYAGWMYGMAVILTEKRTNSPSAGLYSADLLGGATGLLIISLIFLPLLGLQLSALSMLLLFVLFIGKSLIRRV